MLKLRVKWTLFVVLIQVAALLLSGGISAAVSSAWLTRQVRASQQDLAALTLRVQEEEGLSLERMAEIFEDRSTYQLEFSNELPALSPEQLARLQGGEVVSIGRGDDMVTYFQAADAVGEIRTAPTSALASQVTLRWLINALLMFSIGLAAMWMLAMAISKPIVQITEAAERVAKGDFSAKVPLRRQTKKHPYDEVEALAATFNQMTDDLKSIEYLRKDFTSSVSHEIKSPIATISGYAQLLRDETLDAETRRAYTLAISESCAQLSRLSDNLLRITRLESGKRKPLAEPFQLDEQLRRTLAAMMPEFRRRKLELSVDLCAARIVSDRELLEQVWQNLLRNAIKFTPEGGSIRVGLTTQEGAFRVQIADTGIGIDESAQKHIFEKFFQADTSHHTEGSGLGLSLVKRIVDACGGEITVESQLGKGSTFSVTLPARPRG
ncbi:MAG: HAMP domain-containing sensor histidine kinase [Candidatus Aphodomonas sp.]|nr:HAMP domain-containing sensor histidine kinase [Candidatus Aphodomonas sp.]